MYKIRLVKVLGVPIARLTLSEISEVSINIIKSPGKKTLFYVNAHCLNLAINDKEYKKILKDASLVYAGGVGPVIASKLHKKSLVEKTSTPDFIDNIFSFAQKNNWSLYLVGTTSHSLKLAVKNLRKKFPGLKIVGFHNGFFTKDEEEKVIRDINNKKPTIVFVGMGTPKQEKWINDIKVKTNAKAYWAVGAIFDVISGFVPRAPLWMRQIGLEWLYRLIREPRRLWKRYLIGNLKFILAAIKD